MVNESTEDDNLSIRISKGCLLEALRFLLICACISFPQEGIEALVTVTEKELLPLAFKGFAELNRHVGNEYKYDDVVDILADFEADFDNGTFAVSRWGLSRPFNLIAYILQDLEYC